MNLICHMKFGSHLYGTDTPASDLDFKGVYIPEAMDILLQRVRGSISSKRPKGDGEKNYAGEQDEEVYSLQRYLGLLAEGQTVALDMLFAPAWAMTRPAHPIWLFIQDNRHRLVTRKSTAFIGYCRQQANKYGIKGSRVAASRAALALLNHGLEAHGTVARLDALAEQIKATTIGAEHMALIDIEVPGRIVRHWDVCNRKMPFTSSIKTARDIMRRLVDEYGHRALLAEQQEGVDWKALSHAVRVGHQALELLATGNVTFPLPNAVHILRIKKGELPYQQVATEIEDLFAAMEAASAMSPLPAEADEAFIDELVLEAYRSSVTAAAVRSVSDNP